MTRVRLMLLALVALFAASLAASAVASAASTNNPRWSLCLPNAGGTGQYKDANCSEEDPLKKSGFDLTLLAAGGTGVLEGAANGAQKLTPSAGGGIIICNELKLNAGAQILGSNAPNAGTSEETIEYGKCEVEKFAKCEINKEASGVAKIKTQALKDLLAFENEKEAKEEKGPTVTVFTPASGTVFAEFELSGTCPVTGKIKVEGAAGKVGVVAQNVAPESAQETHELNAPATTITKYFVNNAGKTEEKKVELKAFGVKATYSGKGTVKVKDKAGGNQDRWGIHVK